MDALSQVLIILTAGFTASAIVANVYRIVAFVPETTFGHFLHVVVLMVSGPSEMFENAIEARNTGRWSALGFWLAISGVCYWSLILGLTVLYGVSEFFAVA